MSWREEAACVGVAPRVFFPTEGQTYDAARSVCGRCPVSAECLDFALEVEARCGMAERHGMYGGITLSARYKMRRKTEVCRVCGDVFPASRRMGFCTEECRRVYRVEYQADWHNAHKGAA